MGNARAIRILVAEDDEALREVLEYNLKAEGYAVTFACDGVEALQEIRRHLPDLAILDWMMPKLSGLGLLSLLRAEKATKDLPVIVMTARTAVEDRVAGFHVGADDYVIKPFSMLELMQRIKGLLRRAQPEPGKDYLKIGDISLDTVTRRVTRDGRNVHLSPSEFDILELLMQNRGRIHTRRMLLENVPRWQQNDGSSKYNEQTVDVHIGRLRLALCFGRKDRFTNPIRTVRNGGYAFDEKYES